MTAERVLKCEVVPLGDVVTGIWCSECSLPSKISQDFMMVLNGSPFEVFHSEGCIECRSGWKSGEV